MCLQCLHHVRTYVRMYVCMYIYVFLLEADATTQGNTYKTHVQTQTFDGKFANTLFISTKLLCSIRIYRNRTISSQVLSCKMLPT